MTIFSLATVLLGNPICCCACVLINCSFVPCYDTPGHSGIISVTCAVDFVCLSLCANRSWPKRIRRRQLWRIVQWPCDRLARLHLQRVTVHHTPLCNQCERWVDSSPAQPLCRRDELCSNSTTRQNSTLRRGCVQSTRASQLPLTWNRSPRI